MLVLIEYELLCLVDLLCIDVDGECWWCVNVVSGGFGIEVIVDIDEGLKKMLGGLVYLVIGILWLGCIELI